MPNQCTNCGSYAINYHLHGRDNSDLDLCDVCYWRKRAENATQIERERCISEVKPYTKYSHVAKHIAEAIRGAA
jgi:hypothetical protein